MILTRTEKGERREKTGGEMGERGEREREREREARAPEVIRGHGMARAPPLTDRKNGRWRGF